MPNVEISQGDHEPCLVHHLLRGDRRIHRDYGLWILNANRAGASPPHEIQRRYFEFYSLSHMYDGHGMYWTPNGRILEVNAGQGILVAPQFVHFYGGNKQNYVEDSICFHGPLADVLLHHGIIRNGILEIGRTRRLLHIIELAADPAVDAQLSANIALQQLLLDLFHENRRQHRREQHSLLEELIKIVRSSPEKWWTIDEMAEYCNLSSAQFRRVFLLHTGLLPKLYIDRLKISQASEILLSGHSSIEEVAARLGYRDPFHFSRRFKQLTGMSPETYRREHPQYTDPAIHGSSL